MTRAEILAHNGGVAAVVGLAAASAEALRDKLTRAPTRYNFAIAALEAIVEAGPILSLPLPPDEPEAADGAFPKPRPSSGGVSARGVSAA